MADTATEGLEERKELRELEQLYNSGGPATALQSVIPSVAGPGAPAPPEQDPAAILREAIPDADDSELDMRQMEAMYDRVGGGYEDDEAFAAKYMEQDTLEGPSMTAGLRAEMSFWGDTEEERRAVFEAVRPNGEMFDIPGTEITVFREEPTEPWRKVDKGVVDAITSDSFLKETGRDIAEFAVGEGPEMVGEAVAMLLTKGKAKGGGVAVKNLFRLMAGNFIGGAGQEAAQEVRGTRRETAGEFASRQATEASMSALGAGLFGGVSSGVARLKGKGHAALIGGKPGAEEAITATERIFPRVPKEKKPWHLFDWQKYHPRPGVPVNYLTDLPLVQRVGRIAAAIMPTLNRYVLDVDQRVKHTARAMVDPAKRRAFMKQATEGVENSARKAKEAASRALQHKSKHPRVQGGTIKELIGDWRVASGKDVDALAAIARSIHDPDFDLAPALKEADDILFRTVTPGKHVATGKKIGRGAAEEIDVPLVPLGPAPSPALKEFIGRFKSIDEGLPRPTLPDGTPAPSKADRIQAMMRELSDMALPAAGGPREPDLQARRLLKSLREVFDNPIGGGPEFNRAWDTMKKAAHTRFKTMEELAIMSASATKRPSEIVDNIVMNKEKAATIDDLIAIRKGAGKEGFELIRQEYKGRVLGMMDDPDELVKYLDATQRNVKQMLMSPAEERVVRQQAGKIRQLYKSGIREAADRHTRNRSFLNQIVTSGDTAKTDALADFLMTKGNERMRGDFQYALMDEIIEGSMKETTEGVERISGREMLKQLQKHGSEKFGKEFAGGNGLLELLEPSQVKQLMDVRAIQRLLDGAVEDAGTSLAGASAASGFFSGSMAAIGKVVHMLGTSKVLRSPGVAKFMVGTGGKAVGTHSTRRTAMLVGSIATHLMRGLGDRPDDEKKYKQLEKITSLVPSATP